MSYYHITRATVLQHQLQPPHKLHLINHSGGLFQAPISFLRLMNDSKSPLETCTPLCTNFSAHLANLLIPFPKELSFWQQPPPTILFDDNESPPPPSLMTPQMDKEISISGPTNASPASRHCIRTRGMPRSGEYGDLGSSDRDELGSGVRINRVRLIASAERSHYSKSTR